MIRFYSIRSKHKAAMSTRCGAGPSHGRVEVTRWELGLGKGRWKRRLRKLDDRIKVRTLWLGPWARYTLVYDGTRTNAEILWRNL